MTARLFHVVAINEHTGRKVYMTSTPCSHTEACTILRKISPYRTVRVQLEGAS